MRLKALVRWKELTIGRTSARDFGTGILLIGTINEVFQDRYFESMRSSKNLSKKTAAKWIKSEIYFRTNSSGLLPFEFLAVLCKACKVVFRSGGMKENIDVEKSSGLLFNI